MFLPNLIDNHESTDNIEEHQKHADTTQMNPLKRNRRSSVSSYENTQDSYEEYKDSFEDFFENKETLDYDPLPQTNSTKKNSEEVIKKLIK